MGAQAKAGGNKARVDGDPPTVSWVGPERRWRRRPRPSFGAARLGWAGLGEHHLGQERMMLGGVCAPRVDGRALEGRLAAARRQRSVRRHDADVRALVVRLDLRVERLQELVAPRGPLGGEEQARGRVERDPRDERSVFARQGGRFEFETERVR